MDAWLQRMYERHGAGYWSRGVAAVAAITGLVVTPAVGLFPAVYLDLSVFEWLLAILVANVAVIISFVVGLSLPTHSRVMASVRAWSAGERSQLLVSTATDWAYDGLRRTVARTLAGAVVAAVPGVVFVLLMPIHDPEPLLIIEITIGTTIAAIGGAFNAFFMLELALRPLRATLAEYDVRPARTMSIATRLLLIIASLSYVAAFAGGYLYTDRSDRDPGELLVIYAIAVVPTVLIVAELLPMFSVGVRAPIRDLVKGQRSVAAGDLSVRVPITATDELGELATGFNEMVDGLRERETLRDENAGLVDELIASRSRIVAAADESRRRVERDLHDGAQQSLVLLNLKLGLIERKLAEDPSVTAELVAESRADLARALTELRDLAHGIYPQVLTTDGLPGALAEAAQQASIPIELSLNSTGRYPAEVEGAVYFCCLEALQNAAKHAGEGASAAITLNQADGELRFEVADDGAGFDSDGAAESAGLRNMADRIGALGGELRVESGPGAGTRIAGTVPVQGRG